MPWQDAVQEVPGGCRLLLEASAGVQEAGFPAGFNPWRGRIGIRVRAAARQGRANEEALEAVARFFGLPAASVRLVAGSRGSHKTVHVGLPRAEALQRLARAMEAV